MNKFTIISFYTPEYKKLAERMRKSAEQFGLSVDILEIPKIDNDWLATIYWRANFVLRMLEKHKSDVVWIDSDAVINLYPALFDYFDGDFGAHIHDFPWKKREILGGTMYFKYNERTLAFVRKWIELNKTLPKQKLSQWIIPKAIEETPGLKVVELPAQYCQIFDLMKESGDPVIEHFQASRKYRNA